MDLNKLNEVINRFGTKMIDSMKAELEENGNLATGELWQSLSYEYQVEAERVLVQFLSADYGKWVDQGREAGSYAPVSQIQQWCEVKGIPVEDSFLINRHIYKFGIEPKPFILPSIENNKQDFLIALMAAYGSLIKIEVKTVTDTYPKQINVTI